MEPSSWIPGLAILPSISHCNPLQTFQLLGDPRAGRNPRADHFPGIRPLCRALQVRVSIYKILFSILHHKDPQTMAGASWMGDNEMCRASLRSQLASDFLWRNLNLGGSAAGLPSVGEDTSGPLRGSSSLTSSGVTPCSAPKPCFWVHHFLTHNDDHSQARAEHSHQEAAQKLTEH